VAALDDAQRYAIEVDARAAGHGFMLAEQLSLAPFIEPITRSYPDYGKGGQFQLLPADKGTVIRFERLDLIPEAVK
jgi:hypothetical protein